jgi:hypothetical protein
MIDRTTGTLRFDDGTELLPRMQISSVVSRSASLSKVIDNDRYLSFRLAPLYYAGEAVSVLLSFVDGILSNVSLAKGSGAQWNVESLPNRQKLRQAYDECLHDMLGSEPPYSFSWGEVSTSVDVKSGMISVLVRYC